MIPFDWDVFFVFLTKGSMLGIILIVFYVFESIIHIDPGFGGNRL